MDPFGLTPDQYAAGAAWASFFVLSLTLGVVSFQLREAQRLRQEQSRPWVVVDYEFESLLVYLAIENVGETVARNVRITFDQALDSTLPGDREIDEVKFFSEPIPNLPPGKKFRVLFDVFTDRASSDLPMSYTAKIEYETNDGKRLYPDTYILDLDMYTATPLPRKDIHDLVKEVEKLRKEVHKWTDGIRGLRVNTVDRNRMIRIRDRRAWIERAQHVRSERGNVMFLRYLIERFLQRRGWIR